MMLSHFIDMLSGALASGERTPGGILLAPHVADYLTAGLERAASHARQTEALAGIIAFAKEGEPRPSAEIHDLSEILGRERASRQASEAGPEAKMFVFPTVPRATFDFSQLDNGGDAA